MAKLFVLILFFIAAAYSVQANDDVNSSGEMLGKRKKIDPRCRKRYGLFAVPDDCTKYLYCSRGQGRILTCPGGRRFDSRKYCTLGEADCGNFNLTQTREDFRCPRQFGVFSYPPDCHKYLICWGTRRELRTCDDHAVYVPHVGCTPYSQEECPSTYRSQAADPCSLPVETGPCNGSLTKYFYNIYTGRCEQFNYSGCKGNANRFETMEVCRRICGDDDDNNVEVTCPKPYGNYSIPEDCTRYISCSQGLVTFKHCPKGLGFDDFLNICVPAEAIQCKEPLPPNDIISFLTG